MRVASVALVVSSLLMSCKPPPPPPAPGPTITTSFKKSLGEAVAPEQVPFAEPKRLDEQPRAPDGAYILAPGAYEMEVETYALSPGKSPSGERTSYLAAELEGPRAKIIAKVMERASWRADVFQEENQQVLWAILIRAWLDPAHPTISVTLHILLTDAEINQINAGAVLAYRDDTMKKILKNVPPEAHEALIAQNKLRRLFLAKDASYADMEAVAVPKLGDEGRGAGTWTRLENGVLVRFQPRNYRQSTLQLVVPEPQPATESAAGPSCSAVDVSTMVAAPDAVNRQRLLMGLDREAPVAKLKEAEGDNEIKTALAAVAARCADRHQPPKPAAGDAGAPAAPVDCKALDAKRRECVLDMINEAANPRVVAQVGYDKKKAPLPVPTHAQGARCAAAPVPACPGYVCVDAVVMKKGAAAPAAKPAAGAPPAAGGAAAAPAAPAAPKAAPVAPAIDQIAAAYDFVFGCGAPPPAVDPKARKRQVEILGIETTVITPP